LKTIKENDKIPHSMVMEGYNLSCEKCSITERDLQFPCNSIKITTTFFTGIEK
jgi:hypothetical protein